MSGTMRAAVRTALGRLEMRDVPLPRPAEDQALVRVERAAICGSDVHNVFDGLGFLATPAGNLQPVGGSVRSDQILRALAAQRSRPGDVEPGLPGRPGHEGVGVVIESRTSELKAGDRVLALRSPCFAEYLVTRPAECIVLPDGPSMETLLMAQQLGVVIYGLDTFWPRAEAPPRVAGVIGCGPIGLNFVQLLKRRGVERVIACDVEPLRVELARAVGADVTVDARSRSIVDAVHEATEGMGADLMIEAAGYDATRADCVRGVRQHGRIGFFGYPESLAAAPFPFAEAFWKAPLRFAVVKGAQTVAGMATFKEAVRMIASGELPVDHLLGCEYRLDQIQSAIEAARDRRAVKVQITFQTSN